MVSISDENNDADGSETQAITNSKVVGEDGNESTTGSLTSTGSPRKTQTTPASAFETPPAGNDANDGTPVDGTQSETLGSQKKENKKQKLKHVKENDETLKHGGSGKKASGSTKKKEKKKEKQQKDECRQV